MPKKKKHPRADKSAEADFFFFGMAEFLTFCKMHIVNRCKILYNQNDL